jgi:hypothetical protein
MLSKTTMVSKGIAATRSKVIVVIKDATKTDRQTDMDSLTLNSKEHLKMNINSGLEGKWTVPVTLIVTSFTIYHTATATLPLLIIKVLIEKWFPFENNICTVIINTTVLLL